MNLFDDLIRGAKEEMLAGEYRLFDLGDEGAVWPTSSRPELVLEMDTGVELGHPAVGSLSLLLWTTDASLVHSDRLTLVGPDLQASGEKRLPFVKIVVLLVDGFHETNCYVRHRDLCTLHHRHILAGYMVRTASLYQQEWSRVARYILGKGYGFDALGRALSRRYRKQPYVQAVELMVSTSLSPGPQAFETLGHEAGTRIAAMNRMHEELAFDCSDCEYTEVCTEVTALRAMHKSLEKGHGDSGEVAGGC